VLPDGFFSNQKSQFVKTLEGLAMEDVGISYVHLVNFPAIWHILWQFDICVYPRFGTFFPVLVCCTKKNLATLPNHSPTFVPVLRNRLCKCLIQTCLTTHGFKT
jgi:hypothetical protein